MAAADATQEATVPQWAAQLAVSVARIETRTDQIPKLVEDFERLRQNTVPMSEHHQLMTRVEELWNRDLQGRDSWSEMVPRVAKLWQNHEQGEGARNVYRVWLVILSAAVALLTLFTLLRGLGLGISIHT